MSAEHNLGPAATAAARPTVAAAAADGAAAVAASTPQPALNPEQSLAVSRAQIAAALQQPLALLLLQRVLGPKRPPIA